MDEAEDLRLRLEQVMRSTAGDQASFARELSESPQNVSNYLSGRSKRIPYTLLSKIVDRYPEIDARWLLTGKGKGGEGGEKNTHIEKTASDGHIMHMQTEGDGAPIQYVAFPMIEIVSKENGFALAKKGMSFIAFRRDHVQEQWGFDPVALRSVRISSDALSRKFRVGEEVLVDALFEVARDEAFLRFRFALDAIKEEGYYLLATPSGRTLWRQVAIGDQPDTLIAISHEPDVPSMLISDVNKKQFFAVYQIIAGEPPLYALPGRRGAVAVL